MHRRIELGRFYENILTTTLTLPGSVPIDYGDVLAIEYAGTLRFYEFIRELNGLLFFTEVIG